MPGEGASNGDGRTTPRREWPSVRSAVKGRTIEFMTGDINELRLRGAERIAALADALRAIPPHLAPVRRASTVAIREQIYYGYEAPVARARGDRLLFGKYEIDSWWSEAAAELVRSGAAARGGRHLEREHVEPLGKIAEELLAAPRTPAEIVDLLESRLITCTVLPSEHRRLRSGSGWERYEAAGIAVRRGLHP